MKNDTRKTGTKAEAAKPEESKLPTNVVYVWDRVRLLVSRDGEWPPVAAVLAETRGAGGSPASDEECSRFATWLESNGFHVVPVPNRTPREYRVIPRNLHGIQLAFVTEEIDKAVAVLNHVSTAVRVARAGIKSEFIEWLHAMEACKRRDGYSRSVVDYLGERVSPTDACDSSMWIIRKAIDATVDQLRNLQHTSQKNPHADCFR